MHQILDYGKKWNLVSTLSSGGSAIFPHAYLSECGHQIAAVVHGCLDSGADQVLLLGVTHSLTDDLMASRMKEQSREDISQELFWGVLGPDTGRNECWKNEYSLFHFKTLWNAEVKRRGMKGPKLIERYPCLVNREPEKLPGINELTSIAKDTVVVATADLCHHGAAYGVPQSDIIGFGSEGMSLARSNIEKGFDLLEQGSFSDYYSHCCATLSDSIDSCTVLRYLLGKLSSQILELKLVDVSPLFEGDPSPSWVAVSLVELKKS